MTIRRVEFSIGAAVGEDGAATATDYSRLVRGEVLKVAVTYQDSPPATTDFTLSDESDPNSEAIVSLTDAATDVTIYPRRVTGKNDGTDILYTAGEEVHEPYVVHGRLEATIAGADAGDSVDVVVWLRE